MPPGGALPEAGSAGESSKDSLPVDKSNFLQDGSFEGSFPNGPYWESDSSNFGTSLCTLGACGNGGGTAGPRTGNVWAWFGGIAPQNETGYVKQRFVTFPVCGAKLQFYLWIGAARSGSDANDRLVVQVENTQVFSANATQRGTYSSYKLVTVDLSAFADGIDHNVTFLAFTTGQLVTFNVDDVSLVSGPCVTISGSTGRPTNLRHFNVRDQMTWTDANGSYSIQVPLHWSGTVAPDQDGTIYSPASRTYTNLTINRTGQNFTPFYSINGWAGVPGVTLSYVDGTPKTAISGPDGSYNISVPIHWSGTVTPSKSGYRFSPANRTYSNVTAHQGWENYTAIPLYAISGDVGVAGATLSYTDVTEKTVKSLADGSYLFFVPGGWNGTVTPSHTCFTFDAASRDYSNVSANQPAQDYTPTFVPASGCADIDISVGDADQGRFALLPGASTRASFPGLDGGPVKLDSTNAVPLIGAERLIYKVGNVPTSFTEMMGLPNSQLDTTYWLPWYNNLGLDTQLRFANVSNATASVHVFIGGDEMDGSPFTLLAGESLKKSFPGIDDGPVQIVSDQDIVAAARLIYKVGGANTSFSEIMALPASQLDSTYWLPWYNNTGLDTQLRFANVTDQIASVHIYIGGEEMIGSPFTLQPGESTRKSFPGIDDGPVKIESDQNIVAAERLIYKASGLPTSFTEMMALPDKSLDTTYWLPWYNNTGLDTQLRFANVSDQTATVHIYIGDDEMNESPLTLPVDGSMRISFEGIDDGPVQIVSDQNIVVAERLIYKVGNVPASFSEMMALPNSQLDTTYWFPWYNNLGLDTQLRFGVP
jgi:uncharacterized protein YcfL